MIEVLVKIHKITFMGKQYHLLEYPQGNFLLTNSEFKKVKVKKFKRMYRVKMPISIRNKAYYRFQHFISEHPTFLKKVNKMLGV